MSSHVKEVATGIPAIEGPSISAMGPTYAQLRRHSDSQASSSVSTPKSSACLSFRTSRDMLLTQSALAARQASLWLQACETVELNAARSLASSQDFSGIAPSLSARPSTLPGLGSHVLMSLNGIPSRCQDLAPDHSRALTAHDTVCPPHTQTLCKLPRHVVASPNNVLCVI